MKCVRWNISPIKYLSRLIILLLVLALLLSSASLPPLPPTPPTPPPNEPPIINSLTTEKEVITLSESQIACEASDPNSDNLTYQWSADGGTIKGEGSNITWVAPDVIGNYTIKVTVADGKGGTVSESATIAVIETSNQPPTISGLTINGSPPGEENRVKPYAITTLQCKAQDPDGDKLSYLWRATGGNIKGVGNTVTWIAPGVNGNHTITVVVTDGRDGKADTSIVFKVACCGGGF
jgi:hypothetical protein